MLDIKVLNALKRAGIEPDQTPTITDRTLLRLRDFGPKSLRQVRSVYGPYDPRFIRLEGQELVDALYSALNQVLGHRRGVGHKDLIRMAKSVAAFFD